MGNIVRWTPEQLAEFQSKKLQIVSAAPLTGKEAMQALGRLKSGEMNKTEIAYDAHLAALKHIGQVIWYRFECIKFRLADHTFYEPDFMVMLADGRVQVHEVKGFWTDDARVKIKVAASMYPFEFIAIKKVAGQWEREVF